MDYKAPARHHDELGQTIYMVKANTFLSCDEPSQHKYRKSETRKEDAAYSGDTRSPIPVISVHSVGNLQYRRQS